MNVMGRSLRSAACCAVAFVWIGRSAMALDWPQWLGPARNGISAETGWSADWPKDGLPVAWSSEVGAGYGSVAVADGRLFAMGNTGGVDTVYALAAESGKLLWRYAYACAPEDPAGYHGPRCTPCVDGGRLYAVSRLGQVFCLDAASGGLIWSRDLVGDFSAKVPFYGYSLSPLVEGDLLIVEPGGKGASTVAFDKRTGNLVWKAGDDEAVASAVDQLMAFLEAKSVL